MRMLPIVVIAALPSVAAAQIPSDAIKEPARDDMLAPEEPPPPYSSPMRDKCDEAIAADPGWQCALRAAAAQELGVEVKCDAATTAAELKSQCEAELAKDTEWAEYNATEAKVAICDAEIGNDADWYFELRQHFDQHMKLETPESAKPKEAGKGSPAREKCNALLMSNPKWHATWKAEFEAINAYEFHEREAGYFATNKKHVFLAYAAFLGLFVVFLVVLFLRQRKLVAEIELLREDVKRAASE